jgi:hypothetical protein
VSVATRAGGEASIRARKRTIGRGRSSGATFVPVMKVTDLRDRYDAQRGYKFAAGIVLEDGTDTASTALLGVTNSAVEQWSQRTR